jgi:hypothetical protein
MLGGFEVICSRIAIGDRGAAAAALKKFAAFW